MLGSAQGLARFAVDSYEAPCPDNASNVHMHLTNYSLNRKADGFKYCDAADGGDGSKRTATSVFERLQRTGRIDDVDEVWDDIATLVARSVGVIQPVLAGSRGRWSNGCFQILGLDVLLDAAGHPWLVEINDHPSLRVDVTLDKEASRPSLVDEAIKLPMLQDAMRIVAELHNLHQSPREAEEEAIGGGPPPSTAARQFAARGSGGTARGGAGGGYAFGTRFVEVSPSAGEARPLELLARLRDIFEMHSPSSSVFEATWGDAKQVDSNATSSAGPRWKAPTFAKFLQSAGLVGGHRASAVAAGLSRPDAELLFASVCGKGGSMDVLDFAEALSRVAARLYPPIAGEPRAAPAELIARLLARHFADGHGGGAPASSRAATAARAQAALKAATSRGAASRKGVPGSPSSAIEID